MSHYIIPSAIIIGILLFLILKVKFTSIDKTALHIIAGIIISIVSGILSYYVLKTGFYSCLIALLVGVIAGVLKEIYDKINGGIFRWSDVGYTTIGSAEGMVALIAIIASINHLGV